MPYLSSHLARASARRAAALFAVATAVGCATTTLGDKLGVDVAAVGSQVELAWDPLHAWGPALGTRGAQLVAEYEVDGRGLVREVVSTSRRVRERALEFTLPEVLKNSPTGPVCLYVQVPGVNNALLPVRKAAGGQDTARFQYAAWGAKVAARSTAHFLAADAQTLEQQLRDATALRERRTAALEQRGWATPQACAAAGPRQAGMQTMTPPVGVLPPEQHDVTARQVCVHRIVNTRERVLGKLASIPVEERASLLGRIGTLAVVAPEAADALLKMPANAEGVVAATLQARQRQARVLTDDWRRYASAVGKDFWPAFGNQDDMLSTIGEAREAGTYLMRQVFGSKLGITGNIAAPSARDQVGAMGALMDAYSGCVDDGKRQLKTNAESWAALQAASPERERRLREYFVNECRAEHQRVDNLRANETRLGEELRRVQGAMMGGAGNSALQPLPTQRQALNGLRCGA